MDIAPTIQLTAAVTQLAGAITLLVMVRKRRRARQGYTMVQWQLMRESQQQATIGGCGRRHIPGDVAEPLAAAGALVHETVRTDAGECTGIGAYLGAIRLYRTADGSYLVRSELGLSSLPRRTSSTEWSGWPTRAEGVRAYYDELDAWYCRDAQADTAEEGGPSAHTAPIEGFDLVAVHAAMAADRVDFTDLDLLDLNLDLTVGSLPARILHAAHTAGYDAAEVRALDLSDETLLPQLTVMAALHQPAC